MYHLLVTLEVSDFELLREFEASAVAIMADYGGNILHALEITHHRDESGDEVHLVSFPDKQAFENYKRDPRHANLADLRARAIASTRLQEVLRSKTY